MKKIIILMVAAVLMAGILAGCATTSRTTWKKNNTATTSGTSSKKGTNDDFYDAKYWEPAGNSNMMERYELVKNTDKTSSERFDKIKRTFFRIINQPEISAFDYQKLIGLRQEVTSQIEWEKARNLKISYTETTDDWFKEFLKDKEKKHNSLTGKITNKTNETLHLVFDVENDESFYFEVAPHEEKYFNIPAKFRESDSTKKREAYFGIAYRWYILVAFVGTDILPTRVKNPNNEVFAEYINYLFDNYSFEMTFDEDHRKYDWQNSNWTLVPRYETEENTLTEVLNASQADALLEKYKSDF